MPGHPAPAIGPAHAVRRYRLAAQPDVVVAGAALACCALELASAATRGLLVREGDGHPGTVRASVLVLAGTLTEALAPTVAAAWQALPEPRVAMAFGACASTGGPYWDAPSVLDGAAGTVPIAAYVPGCPPRPEAIAEGIAVALASLGQVSAA